MNGFPVFTVRRVSWSEAGGQLRAIRTTVFIDEQNVPVELEWDGLDVQCLHVVAESATGEAIGTGRLLPDGHIGRMAVLKPWRGRGVGRALLRAVASEARSAGIRRISLSVGRGNFAHGLYLAEGYQIAETSDAASDTMIREL